MKQKDIALIVVVCAVSAVLSLLLSNVVIGSPKNKEQKAEVVDKITSEFPQPDKRYFNEQALNPALPVPVGENANTDPFNAN